MQICAEKNGFTQFSTMQNHYNLLYREDEHELIPICEQYGVSRIPYSSLAAGRLCRREWNTDSKRSMTDKTSRMKYDSTMQQDMKIVERVAELAERYGVSMTEIALSWHLKRCVSAPIVGATKVGHFDAAVKAVDFNLTDEDAAYLEEPYQPHPICGANKSMQVLNMNPKKQDNGGIRNENSR